MVLTFQVPTLICACVTVLFIRIVSPVFSKSQSIKYVLNVIIKNIIITIYLKVDFCEHVCLFRFTIVTARTRFHFRKIK
jgi:hypothetical protein